MTPRAIERALAKFANPERAAFMSGGYSPSRLKYVGASAPEMRSVVRMAHAAMKSRPPKEIIRLPLSLTRGGRAEARQVGWELIVRRDDARALLTPRLVERLGQGNDNWASVDGFSVYLAGVAWREGRIKDGDLTRWARSKNRWWRRTLMISATAVSDRDPMITKALSWALRALVAHDPGAVRRFVRVHRTALAPLVLREVTAKLTMGKKI